MLQRSRTQPTISEASVAASLSPSAQNSEPSAVGRRDAASGLALKNLVLGYLVGPALILWGSIVAKVALDYLPIQEMSTKSYVDLIVLVGSVVVIPFIFMILALGAIGYAVENSHNLRKKARSP